MAMYTTGYSLGITKEQMQAVKLRAEGKNCKQIAEIVFDIRRDDNPALRDEKKVNKGAEKVRRWFRDPKVVNAYREILREFIADDYARALRKLSALIDDKQGWLALNAAQSILNKFTEMMFGEEDKKIVIQVEGMPDLGKPDEG